MRPLRLIEDSGASPNRIESTRQMLKATASPFPQVDPFVAETWAHDGKVYVFLPGLVVVYDWHEYTAELRQGST
jgi:hypothetical protein